MGIHGARPKGSRSNARSVASAASGIEGTRRPAAVFQSTNEHIAEFSINRMNVGA